MHSLSSIPSVINLSFVLFLSNFSSNRILYPTNSPTWQFFYFLSNLFIFKLNHLSSNSRTNSNSSHPSGLSDTYESISMEILFIKILGDLGGFTTSSFTCNHNHLIWWHCEGFYDFGTIFVDWKVFTESCQRIFVWIHWKKNLSLLYNQNFG